MAKSTENPAELPDLPGEGWRIILGWEGMYMVSSLGRIKGQHGRIMRPAIQHNGYLGVVFVGKGKPKRYLVHRLVAQAFVPNPERYATVDHVDGSKTMNHFANLEWVPLGENRRRAIAMGLAKKPPRRDGRGSRNNMAKLTEDQVREILSSPHKHGNGKLLAERFGVRPSTISQILRGRNWTHIKPN